MAHAPPIGAMRYFQMKTTAPPVIMPASAPCLFARFQKSEKSITSASSHAVSCFFIGNPPVVIFSIIARLRAKIQHARRLTLRAVVRTIGETTGKSEWIKKQRR
jgi:hypothetical protein